MKKYLGLAIIPFLLVGCDDISNKDVKVNGKIKCWANSPFKGYEYFVGDVKYQVDEQENMTYVVYTDTGNKKRVAFLDRCDVVSYLVPVIITEYKY